MQLAIDGILINYQIIGDQKDILLILHGWKSDIAQWNKAAQMLSDKYKVVLVDLPGHGNSTKPNHDYNIYEYADFVVSFTNKLNLKAPINLLGHSLGGRISIILAAKKLLDIKRLILVDSAGIEQRSLKTNVKIAVFKLGKTVLLPIIGKSNLEKLKDKILEENNYKHAGNMRGTLVKIVNEDLSYLLPKIDIPTLIIWGDRDEVLDIKYAKKFKEQIPTSRIRIVWGAKHRPHLDKLEDFITILNEEIQ